MIALEKLTFEELRLANKARDMDFGGELMSMSLEHWTLKMLNEAAEVGGAVEKSFRGDNNPTVKKLNNLEIGNELADVVILCDLLAQRLGLNLESCVVNKFNMVSNKINSSVKLDNFISDDNLKWDKLSYNEKEALRKKRPETWRKLYREKFGVDA